jgi:hypothetical protein
MTHAAAHGGVLHPTFAQDPALAVLIGVPELPGSAVGHHFDPAVRVKRPDRAEGQGVIIEDPQSPKLGMFRVVVLIKEKMPAALEAAVLDSAVGLIDAFRGADNNYGFSLPIWAVF